VVRPGESVRIDYLRPPDRREVFIQRLLLDTPEVKVTLAESVPFDPPIRIEGRTALERGSDAVWFTFPGLWHDIGRFHRAHGQFTGIYANILTPPVIHENGVWETTDLFLDLWLDPEGRLTVLDEDQLEEAVVKGWVSDSDARRAKREVERIERAFQTGDWPPRIVQEWTLTRARSVSAGYRAAGLPEGPREGPEP
jgi:predicted RNA-binding protein associated with RNAse of E/G family